MVTVIFRSYLRSDADMALVETTGQRIYQLGSAMPGFVSYKEFAAADGEALTLVEFDTAEHLNAWRNQSEHRDAQERGRREFFSSYDICVCEPQRRYRFSAAEGRVELVP
jgi:heme-degrading monooxygenase HmoA